MRLLRSLAFPIAMVFLLSTISCSRTEESAPKESTPAAQLAPSSQRLLDMLPADESVPGWTRNKDVRFFDPGNLWEYIDGAAEGYLNYGFQEVVTAEYNNAAQASQAVIDIYQMKDARSAFGMYAAELNPDSEFKKIGVEGYIGGTALNFWAGPYYVKITVFQESDELKAEMEKLAGQLCQRLGDPGTEPAEVGYFPREDLIAHSVRYLPKDVLGQSYLEEAFEARYRQGSGEFKLIAVALPDSSRAGEAMANYRQFVTSSGKVQKDLTAPADGGFSGTDSFYGNLAVVRSGSRIIIALGGPSPDFSLSRIHAVLSNIR